MGCKPTGNKGPEYDYDLNSEGEVAGGRSFSGERVIHTKNISRGRNFMLEGYWCILPMSNWSGALLFQIHILYVM